jgi:hypothetical protein
LSHGNLDLLVNLEEEESLDMRKFLMSTVITSAFLLSFSNLASASTVALTDPEGSHFSAGSDQLYAWIFSVNTPITVTSLGVYDENKLGLADSHAVGIFRQSNQSLLGSVTVPSGECGTLLDHFCFQSVSPFGLTPDTYVIAMTMPFSTSDLQVAAATSYSTASEITYLNSAFDGSSVLAFPNPGYNGAFSPGMFGPDFTFTSSAVPEPSTYSAIGAGLIALFTLARRRRSR